MRMRHLCLLVASLLFVLPQQVRAIEKIVLGYSGVGSGEEVHHFAKEVGLFKKYGLDVEIVYIPGGSTVVQSMIAGDVQFGRGSATEVVTAHLAGFPLKILTALINKFVYSFVTPMNIARPQDLKGKAVAVSRFGSGSDFITRLALKSWGLEPVKDVTILQIGNSPERLAAVAGGKVQGSILSLSQTPRAKKLGLRVLADLSQIDAEYPQGVLYAPAVLDRKTTGPDRSFSKSLYRGSPAIQNESTRSLQCHCQEQRPQGQKRHRRISQVVDDEIPVGLPLAHGRRNENRAR